MRNEAHYRKLEGRLLALLSEMRGQPHVARAYGPEHLPYEDEMTEIGEFIEVGEYGCAYEVILASLENRPLMLSGHVAVQLLELGLLLGFKTERPEDREFDRRADPE